MRRARPLLGTYVEVGVSTVAAVLLGKDQTRTLIQQAFAKIETVHNCLSFHSPYSELTRLNTHPGQWVTLSPLTLRVLRLARALMLRTQNRFNCTCGATLVAAGKLPNPFGDTPLHELIPSGTAADILLTHSAAKLKRPLFITLDGIAKGFAVDQAIGVLKAGGLSGGWVNAGGDLRDFGDAVLAINLRCDSGFKQIESIKNIALATSHTQPVALESFPAMIVGVSQDCSTLITVQADRAWKADAMTKVAACSSAAERSRIMQLCGASVVHH